MYEILNSVNIEEEVNCCYRNVVLLLESCLVVLSWYRPLQALLELGVGWGDGLQIVIDCS